MMLIETGKSILQLSILQKWLFLQARNDALYTPAAAASISVEECSDCANLVRITDLLFETSPTKKSMTVFNLMRNLFSQQ